MLRVITLGRSPLKVGRAVLNTGAPHTKQPRAAVDAAYQPLAHTAPPKADSWPMPTAAEDGNHPCEHMAHQDRWEFLTTPAAGR